jgi:hypothetical protein
MNYKPLEALMLFSQIHELGLVKQSSLCVTYRNNCSIRSLLTICLKSLSSTCP